MIVESLEKNKKQQGVCAILIIIATIISIVSIVIISSFIFIEPSSLHQNAFDFGDPNNNATEHMLITYFGDQGFYKERIGLWIIEVHYKDFGKASSIEKPTLNDAFAIVAILFSCLCLFGSIVTTYIYFKKLNHVIRVSSFMRINITIVLMLIALCIIALTDKPTWFVNSHNYWWQAINGDPKKGFYDVDWQSHIFKHNWEADATYYSNIIDNPSNMYEFSLFGVLSISVICAILVFVFLDLFLGIIISYNRYRTLTRYKSRLLDDTIDNL
ncbi:MAG: hypothetical protein LBG49_02375 [Mycoplasmataceae bacterium]|nr:hypothetical protein [Mycoplasmataceae bacterium]